MQSSIQIHQFQMIKQLIKNGGYGHFCLKKKKSQASGQEYNPQCNVSVKKIRLDLYYFDFHEYDLP